MLLLLLLLDGRQGQGAHALPICALRGVWLLWELCICFQSSSTLALADGAVECLVEVELYHCCAVQQSRLGNKTERVDAATDDQTTLRQALQFVACTCISPSAK